MNRDGITKDEKEIFDRIPHGRVEEWVMKQEYWRIYQIVIQITKDYYSLNHSKSSGSEVNAMGGSS